MRIALVVIFLISLCSCKQDSQPTKKAEEVDTKPLSQIEGKPAPLQENQWKGVNMLPLEAIGPFCETFDSFKKDIKTISNVNCMDLELSETTFMSGTLYYTINNKDFQMLIYGFLPDKAILRELPKSGNTEILGNQFSPIEMEEDQVKAYLSEDMLRLYINPETKFVITNTCLTEPSDYRDAQPKSQVDMIEIGNLLLEKVVE